MGNRYWVHSAPEAMGDEALRPCARGERCAQGRNGEPAQGPRVLCSADRDILIRAIDNLPELYLELWMRLGHKGQGGDGPRVSGGGKTPPTPLRLDIEALMARFVETLEGWEERVRIVARLNLAHLGQSRRHGVAISSMCTTLGAHVDVLLALEPQATNRRVPEDRVSSLPAEVARFPRADGSAVVIEEMGGGDAANQILELQHAARSKLGHTPRHQDLLSPCWNVECEQRMLRRWDGAAGLQDFVECRACGEKYEGERLARLMTEEQLAQQRRAQKEAS